MPLQIVLALLPLVQSQEDGPNLQETRLATLPEGVTFKPLLGSGHGDRADAVFSPTGRGVIYPAGAGDRQFLMFADVKGPDLAKVLSPVWSPDGRAWAYVAVDQQEVYIGGTQTLRKGKGDTLIGDPVFSPDGKKIAFLSGPRQKQVLVIGERELGRRFGTVLGNAVFSPDGSQIAFPAESLTRSRKNALVSIDDDPAPGGDTPYEAVIHLTFSPDGRRFAFVAETQQPLLVSFVICDGKAEATYGQIQKPVFSPDSKRLAYAAYEKGLWYPVVDGKKGPGYFEMGNLAWSPDGSEVAFRARKTFDAKAFVMKGTWKSDEFPAILWGPVYSPDGSQVAFGAGLPGGREKESIHVGTQRRATCDEVWSRNSAPTGRR